MKVVSNYIIARSDTYIIILSHTNLMGVKAIVLLSMSTYPVQSNPGIRSPDNLLTTLLATNKRDEWW